jgi:hypothetical protein
MERSFEPGRASSAIRFGHTEAKRGDPRPRQRRALRAPFAAITARMSFADEDRDELVAPETTTALSPSCSSYNPMQPG